MVTWTSLSGEKDALRYKGRKRRRWPEVYCSTYCNFGHRVSTGRPIDHECITIPPSALKAEIEGEFDEAISIMEKARGKRKW